ncbi:MAG: tyrosine-type recombinase/integrase, partial [Oscillospiraceae bacterium]|nr:tyrosine-type recombinase/integrase [Oscillospiraceae bacterium]
MKTEAGKNRCVPIHSRIRPLVEKWYDPDRKQLFYDDNGKNGSEMDYGMYYTRFKEIMERLNMDHIPHEVRHTFITRAKEADLNEYCLKLIIGHNVNDVTERVYTHRTIENLRTEIEKIK